MGEPPNYNRFGRSTAKLKHEESAWFDLTELIEMPRVLKTVG
jgi:hypothetical protein